MKFKSDIEVQSGLKDSSGSNGSSGQVLSSNGSTVSWVNAGSSVANDVQNQVKAGVAINKGQAVYVTGADGTNIIVGLASNTTEATSSKTLGLLNATVAVNGFADVVQIGKLAGLNTSAATVGDPVWLGTNGNLIYGLANKPYAPAHLVFIGVVTRVNANNGEIFVTVQNGFELNEIHDVDLKTNVPINGDVLGYNGTLWVNKTIAGWLGYTPVPTTRTITINGTTQDLSANQSWTIASGVTSFNTRTGAITLTSGDVTTALGYTPVTQARTLTINGTTYDLSANRSWTVTGGLGGSGTATYLPKFTAATTVADSQLIDNGTYLSIGNPTNTRIKWGGTTTPTLGLPFSPTNALWLEVNDGDTGGIAIDNDGVTVYGAGDNGYVFRVIDEDVYQSTLNVDASTNFYVTQGQNGGGYIRGIFNVTDYLTAGSSARAPIFYDSNDTTYYGDFASTSNFSKLLLNSQNSFNTTTPGLTSYGLTLMGGTADYANGVTWTWGNTNAQAGVYVQSSGAYGTKMYFATTDSFATGSKTGMSMDHNGTVLVNRSYLQSDSSLRAPIFYDSNNTGYYVDPASMSNIGGIVADNWFRSIGQTGLYSQTYGVHFAPTGAAAWQITGSGGNVELQFRSNHNSTVRGYVYADTSNNIGFLNNGGGWALRTDSSSNAFIYGTTLAVNVNGAGSSSIDMYDGDEGNRSIHCNSNRIGFLNQSSSWGSYCTDNGDWVTDTVSYAGASSRAPIFYDTNNTGYYVDPTSLSNLNQVTTNGELIVYTGTTSQFQIKSPTGTQSLWVRAGYTANGTGTPASAPTNVQFQSSGSSGGTFTFCTGNDVQLTINGSGITSSNGVYGTIFYDQNNTGYYLDPNSTSNLYAADFSGPSHFTSNLGGYCGSLSNPPLQAYSTSNNSAFFSFHKGGNYAVNMGLDADNVIRIGGWSASASRWELDMSGNNWAAGSFRAPIFYDSNDTGYYIDAASTSNLKFLQVGRPSNGQSGTKLLGGQGTSYGAITLDVEISNYGTGIKINNQGSTYANSAMAFFYNSSQCGGVSIGSNVTYYNTSSDYRLKENITSIDSAVNRLNQLKPCRFNFISNPEKTVDGFIAHEVQEVIPEAVTGFKDEFEEDGTPKYQGIDQSKIVPLLTAALQEAIEKINSLEQRINILENK